MKALALVYTARLSITGGGQNAMTLLARELGARGYEFVFLTRRPLDRDHRYLRRLRQLGVRTELVPTLQRPSVVRVGGVATGVLLTVPIALVRRQSWRAAWRIASSVFATVLGRLERAWTYRRLDRHVRPDRPVLLHIWGPCTSTPGLLDWAAARGAPAVYHEMGEADEPYVATWRLSSTIEAINKATRLVCCSQTVADNVRRVYRYAGAIDIIPFMVEHPRADAVRPAPRTAVVFGAIGRLVPHKRHADLLDALKALADARCDVGAVIAGSGPSRERLEGLTRERGLQDHVVFLGEFEDLSDVMARLDVLVVTSASESQCMPITEAMAYGRPVVAVRVGGMADFVEQGETGFIVDLGDVAALTAAMRTLVEQPLLRERMGRRGRERYLATYTPSKVTDAVDRLYRSLVVPCAETDVAVRGSLVSTRS